METKLVQGCITLTKSSGLLWDSWVVFFIIIWWWHMSQHFFPLDEIRKIFNPTIMLHIETFKKAWFYLKLAIKLYLLLLCHLNVKTWRTSWHLKGERWAVSGIGLRCNCELLSEIRFPTVERKPTPFMRTLFACLFAHARRFIRTCLYFFVYLPSQFLWSCALLYCCPQVHIVTAYPHHSTF